MRALTHALEQQRLHHAYLFTGTRGVGKTTLSRILAKSLNCTGADGEGGITAQPCGICEACVAIDAGRFIDYIEMDAASNRGVDEMAQLLEQAVYAPSNARFKVYMIDEVHMLTSHAFNSMLKTLEEPPEHVKFILATTDPQKIPATVLSRCLQFNLKQMPPGRIIDHLDDILGQEGIEFEVPALRLLAQGAHGSMRDALSLTDQAIAYAAGKVTLEAVQGMLGALDQSYLLRVLAALAESDGAALLAVADDMAARSLSYGAALQDLAALLHRIALAQTVPAALPDDLPEREEVLRLASRFDAEEVQLYYQIAVHGRNELGLAPDEYAGFSMTLLRMLAFRPDSAEASGQAARSAAGAPAAARLNAAPQAASASVAPLRSAAPARAASPARAALEAARGAGRSPPPPVSRTPAGSAAAVANPPWESDSPAMPPSADAALAATVAAAVMPNAPPAPNAGTTPPAAQVQQTPAPFTVATGPSAPAAAPLPVIALTGLDWDGDWPALAAALPLRGVAQQLALQSELITFQGEGGGIDCRLRIPLETLLSGASADKLAAAMSARFERPVRVTTEIGPVQHTASALAASEREARQRQAEQAIQNDPFVQSMMRDFGAAIVPGSIKPI